MSMKYFSIFADRGQLIAADHNHLI